jgi:large subunit ribosomal protein L4
MKSALSGKVAASSMIVVDKLALSEIKTKTMVKVLEKLGADKSALVVTAARDEIVEKSTRNIANIKTALVNTINVYDILKYDKFVITEEAVRKVQEVYV